MLLTKKHFFPGLQSLMSCFTPLCPVSHFIFLLDGWAALGLLWVFFQSLRICWQASLGILVKHRVLHGVWQFLNFICFIKLLEKFSKLTTEHFAIRKIFGGILSIRTFLKWLFNLLHGAEEPLSFPSSRCNGSLFAPNRLWVLWGKALVN